MQVDVEEVSGGLNLVFMGISITNAYHNLTNIILRISPKRALGQPAVLINAHFDSSFGSPGESACCQRWPGRSKVTVTVTHPHLQSLLWGGPQASAIACPDTQATASFLPVMYGSEAGAGAMHQASCTGQSWNSP